MKIGYGFNRHEADFEGTGCDVVYIDMPGSNRVERGAMLDPGGVRPGDTVAVFSLRELGGKAIERTVRARPAEIEVLEPIGEGRRPGAPRMLNLTDKQEAELRALWKNPGYTFSYVIGRARQIAGWPVQRHHMTYRFGERGVRPKKQDEEGRGDGYRDPEHQR